MTETDIEVPLSDGKTAYGKMRVVAGAPLVVLVHGLTGHMDEPVHYIGARYLETAGYSVLRFNLYDDAPNARKLLTCTTSQHARDLEDVVAHIRAQLNPPGVAIIGHSLGALTALLSRDTYDALVLWDPSFRAEDHVLIDSYTWVNELQAFTWHQSVECLLGKPMIDEWNTFDSPALMARRTEPVMIVASDSADRQAACETYFESAGGPKKLLTISGADHCFFAGETLTQLHEETLMWLDEVLAHSTGA